MICLSFLRHRNKKCFTSVDTYDFFSLYRLPDVRKCKMLDSSDQKSDVNVVKKHDAPKSTSDDRFQTITPIKHEILSIKEKKELCKPFISLISNVANPVKRGNH